MGARYSVTNLLATATREVWKGDTPSRPSASASQNFHEAAFPPAHLGDYRAGKVCRAKAPGPCTFAAYLSASSVAYDFIALINHNLRDSATVTFHAGSSASGPWESLPLSIYEGAFFQLIPGPPVTKRYIRVSISGSNPTTDGYPVQIGQLWLGMRQTLPPFQWGMEEGEDFITSYSESEYGVAHTHYLSKRRTLHGRFVPALSRSTADDLAAFYRQVQGRTRAFLLMPDDLRPYNVMLGRLASAGWRRTSVPVARVKGSTHDARINFAGLEFQFQEDPYGATGA